MQCEYAEDHVNESISEPLSPGTTSVASSACPDEDDLQDICMDSGNEILTDHDGGYDDNVPDTADETWDFGDYLFESGSNVPAEDRSIDSKDCNG